MSTQPTELPINQLQPNPFQPRETIKKEDILDLIESVKSYGIIEPLVVAHTPAGYQIIAGERRWRAAKEAGLTKVPVVIRETTPKLMLELALVENVQRKNLNPIERAKGFQQLIREFGFIGKELAAKIGKSQAYVSNSLRLLDLPDMIKDGLIKGLITEGHARALISLENESMMIDCYRQLVNEGASVRRAEELVRVLKNRLIQAKFPSQDRSEGQADQIEANSPHDQRLIKLKKSIKAKLSQPTKIKLTRSNRQTRLTITFKGSVATTEEDLEKIIELLDRE
jgi:ParB family transcriptional regulator, chromosome partitioning protein